MTVLGFSIPYKIVAWLMSLAALVLLGLQFRGRKGTWWHIIQGTLPFLLVVAVIVINTVTVTAERGLVWDQAFMIHTGLGGIYLILHLATIRSGAIAWRTKVVPYGHKTLAMLTFSFLALSLIPGILLQVLRR